ncbi:MAG: class B sortase [Anaerovoracaceae bacterium]
MAEHNKKQKKKSSLVLDVIIVILLAVMAFSGWKVLQIEMRYREGTKAYNEVAEEAEVKEKPEDTGLDINWTRLTKKYDNIAGWLYCKNTVINYPVAKYKDNSFYLHHLLNGNYNVKGTLFIDCRQQRPMKDFLTVIYGHHMFDGSMFGKLVKYRDESYYKKHPVMIYSTPEHNYKLRIFGGCTIPAASKRYKFDFRNSAEKTEYLEWIQKNTELTTNVDVTSKDRIVMLSTCTYEYDNARWVVFAKAEQID